MLISENKWGYIRMRLGMNIVKQVMDVMNISNMIPYEFDIS